MCGVAGIFLKRGTERLGPKLVEMLKLIHHRGMDSSGLALYAPPRPGRYYCRVAVQDEKAGIQLKALLARAAGVEPGILEGTNSSQKVYTAVLEAEDTEIDRVYREIDSRAESCVHSLSSSLLVVKDLGEAGNLNHARYLEQFPARHGLAHVRLATESIDNLNYAHPFTSPIYPSLSIAHNGQLTNYFNLRRKLERQGIYFKTNNDSEVIAHYLAYRVRKDGKTLMEAMHLAMDDLDGVFSCIVGTEQEMGIFQDRLGLKPILVHELPDMVLLGSEQICFAGQAVQTGESWEIKPGEAVVWSH